MALLTALYAGGLLWLHHLGSVPVPGRFLAADPGPALDRRLANAGLRQPGARLAKARPWLRGGSAHDKHTTGARRPA